MNVLLDTNVLVRAADPADKDHRVAVDAVAQLRLNGDELHLVPQNFFEFWVVSTREVSKKGRGKSPADVAAELAFFHAQFKVLDDSRPWTYTLGGYRVLKNWLSYREKAMLGRALKLDEIDHIRDTARRIAARRLLGLALDENYANVKANRYPWPKPGEQKETS